MMQRNTMTPLLGLAALAALGFSAPKALAQGAALTFTGGSAQSFSGYTVGWEFDVTAPVTVSSLGWYDVGSDGFTGSHAVGIFTEPATAPGTLLASTTVTSANSLDGGFRYAAINPLVLSPGNYVVAGTSGQDTFQAFADSVTTGPSITFVQGRFISNTGDTLTDPTQLSDRGLAYFGSNFKYTLGAAPEPSPFAGLGLGILGLTGLALRARKRRAA